QTSISSTQNNSRTFDDLTRMILALGEPIIATKTVTATSEASTSDAGLPNAGTSDVPATIGEIVRYQLT
ncbi:MAG TPA: hypothetical protein PLZ51_26705, partial [Aggregatilineales bacterium]|nr:hypothetical protein [Aggregatilineales bacterium]